MKHLHFCSGLPRTGSTVLMNILQQNPDIFTTGTCALPGLLKDHVLTASRFREQFQAMSTDQADKAMSGFVYGGVKGWFEGLTLKPVVISKNRMWPELLHLFPNSKVIVCVRDLRDIVESFDRVNSKIKALHTFGESGVLYPALSEKEKYDYHFKEVNAFSASLYIELPRLMDRFLNNNKNIKFIRYEDFLKEPYTILNSINNFLQVNSFNYDLKNISQSELYEHDNAYFRERTDHKVKKVMVEWKEPKRVLSNNFHNSIIENHKWFYEGFYPEVLYNE